MAFLLFSDIVSDWIFPPLLGLLSLPLIAGYWYLLTHTLYDVEYMKVPLILTALGFMLCFFARDIVDKTLHLRETPRAFLRFMGQFIWLVLLCELLGIALHFAGALLLLALHCDGFMNFSLGCLVLVGLVIIRLIRRTFLMLPMPEPDAEGETLRGQGLQQGEAVERRAWNDL